METQHFKCGPNDDVKQLLKIGIRALNLVASIGLTFNFDARYLQYILQWLICGKKRVKKK